MTEQRQQQYLHLIEQLLACPNGQEPEILDRHLDLIDANFIQALMQVATLLTHQNHQDAAQCLIHIARELAIQLELYPQPAEQS